ncbi:hypothetical protein PsYK624_079030 [Phanerochaete sordida]|uniref:Uncharacterized protein n=1 Tax=Phanerochaete sordida TaxID=48140 RepID=A0A9P3LF79_9APHY|nr:hypothetical protein PsYK624_079030 [Phanerochaete sordida]
MLQKLQAERSYCLPISNSVVRISERSPNAHFRAEVTRLLARLDRKLSKEAQSLSSAYCQHAEIDEDEVRLSPSAALDADVKGTIPCTLSRILRSHVRSPRFKGTGSTAKRADESELPDDFPFVEIDDRSVAMPPLPKAFQAIPWDDLPLGLSGSTLDGTSPGCPAMDASTLPSANGRSLLAILDDVSDSDNVDRAILDNPLGDGTASDSDGNWELGDVDTPCESDCLYEGTSEDEPSSPICSRDSSQSDTLDTPSQSQRDTFADELVLRDDPMDLWTDSCQFSPTALDIPTKISELYLGNEDLLDSDDDLPVNDGERCPIPRSADAADIFETLFDPDDLPPLPTHSNQLTPELRWILYGDDDDELLPIATEDEDGCFDGDGDLLMDEDAAHFIL